MAKKKLDYKLSMDSMLELFNPYTMVLKQYLDLRHKVYVALENNRFLYKNENGYFYLFNTRHMNYVFISTIIKDVYHIPTEDCYSEHGLNDNIIHDDIHPILDNVGLIKTTKDIGDTNNMIDEYMNEINRKFKVDNIIKKYRSESASIILKNL